MATIKRFEDVNAWQKARELAKLIHQVSTHGRFAKDFELKDQINCASGSIMDNIAEDLEEVEEMSSLIFFPSLKVLVMR